MKKLGLIAAVLALGFGTVSAQEVPVVEDLSTPIVKPLRLSGPRVGGTYIPSIKQYNLGERFGDSAFTPSPFISQFGWQFEWRYFEAANGSQGLFELIPLIGGLDQGMILPSLNLIVGYRDASGFEIGAGPNLNLMDPGFVIAAGYNFSSGYMNFPVNVGLTPSRSGMRFTVLVGFNKRDAR